MINNDEIVLAIDYGFTNIGLAFGRRGLVAPIKTISGKNMATAINDIATAVVHNKAKKLVLGLPLSYDGKETLQARKVRGFSKLLKARLKLPVILVDEYGTSIDSLREGIDTGLAQKKRRKIDHLSAALILKTYFEENIEDEKHV